jgi:hypothetical protein
LGSNAAFLLFFTSTIFKYEVSQVSRSYSDSDAQNSNRAGVTLPRFTSQIFTTAARGYSNFNNLRKAAAGGWSFCCGPAIWVSNFDQTPTAKERMRVMGRGTGECPCR